MMKLSRLLLATNNKGKVEEIRAILNWLPVELVTPDGIDLKLEVAEDGQTYIQNAGKKALAFARATQLIALADDSGLEVDALGGAPGLYSHRYSSSPNATDAHRRAFLLKNLWGKPRPWIARFRAAVAIAVPGQPIQSAEGECLGEIIPVERGMSGFGYDPIFFLPDLGKTMAELSMDEKNRLSHRANALLQARPILERIFGI